MTALPETQFVFVVVMPIPIKEFRRVCTLFRSVGLLVIYRTCGSNVITNDIYTDVNICMFANRELLYCNGRLLHHKSFYQTLAEPRNHFTGITFTTITRLI